MLGGLVLLVALGNAGVDDSLQAVEKDFRKVLAKVTPEGGVTVDDLWPLIDRCLDLADEAEEDGPEYEALEWTLRIANFRFAPTYERFPDLDELYTGTLERIIDGFVDHPPLGRLVLSFDESDRAALDRIAKETTAPAIKAALRYRDLSHRMDQHRFGRLDRAAQEQLAAELKALIEEYGTLADPLGRGTFGELAGKDVFELEHLSLGCVAPDIAGEDLDGVAFKLSDYRGKVVLLDFWGHW